MGIIQRQSIKSSIATYIGVAIGAINLVFLFPHFLTTEQLGLTRVLIAVSILFSQAALLGTPFALIRFFPFFRSREKKHFGFVALMFRITIVGFLFASLIVYALHTPIENVYSKRSPLFSFYFLWVFPLAFLITGGELIFNYCRALLKLPIPFFFREVVLRLGQTAAILLYIIKSVDFNGFLILFVGSYLLQLILLVAYIIYLKEFFFFSRINLEGKIPFAQILRFSLLMFVSVSAGLYTNNIDVILLSYLLSLSNTAVYSIAFFVGTIIQVPARSMNMIAASVAAQAWKDGDLKKIQQLYSQTSLTQLIVGGFIFLLIWINTDLLLSLLPSEYQEAKWVIFVIGIGKLFDMATGINGEIINVSRHVKVNLFTNIFLIVVSTLSNYFLIKQFGIIGAAMATALSLFFYNAIRMVFLYQQYRLQPFDENTIKSVALIIIAFSVAWILPDTKNLWLSGIYQSIVVSVIFVVPLIYFRLSEDINNAYRSLLLFLRV